MHGSSLLPVIEGSREGYFLDSETALLAAETFKARASRQWECD